MAKSIENLENAFDEMFDFITDLPSGLDGFESDFDSAFEELRELKATLTPPNEPLTLEQLREMDGEPVYMVDLTGGTLWDQWIIFERHTYDGFIPRGGGYFGCASYGGKWLAYRRPPEGEV